VVEAFIGLGAYMEIAALNRRLGEGPTVSGVNLRVDPALLPAFHERVKQTPAAGAVNLRRDNIRNFHETAAKSMRITTFFMTLFAVVVACGVVYNYARLILGERSRELASTALKVASGALFRRQTGWAVFRVVDGIAVEAPVSIGRDNGLEAEVLDGLDEGDVVVLHPSDAIEDGVRVAPR
jgi:hypothetical protein